MCMYLYDCSGIYNIYCSYTQHICIHSYARLNIDESKLLKGEEFYNINTVTSPETGTVPLFWCNTVVDHYKRLYLLFSNQIHVCSCIFIYAMTKML